MNFCFAEMFCRGIVSQTRVHNLILKDIIVLTRKISDETFTVQKDKRGDIASVFFGVYQNRGQGFSFLFSI